MIKEDVIYVKIWVGAVREANQMINEKILILMQLIQKKVEQVLRQ